MGSRGEAPVLAPAQRLIVGAPTPYGWPFLVSRGRNVGYRTILAPGFLVDSGEASLLATAVRRVEDGPGVQIDEVSLPRSGSIEVVYRAERAMTDASGQDTLEPIRDSHSRPIRLFYGFVTCGPIGAASPADLSHCREVALEAFDEFLEDEASSVQPATAPFPLESVPGRRSVAAEPTAAGAGLQPAPSRRSRRRAWALDAALLGATCVVALLILLRFLSVGGGIEADGSGCASLTPAAPTCVVGVTAGEEAEPMLTVSVSPADQRLHWEVVNGCTTLLPAGASCEIRVTLAVAEGEARNVYEARLQISAETGSPVVELAGSTQSD